MRKYASDTLFISKVIQKFKRLNTKLGDKRYSIIAFIAGGGIEFCMVNLKVRGANYYKSFIEKEALREAEKIFYSKRNKELVEELLRKTPKEALDSVEFKVNSVFSPMIKALQEYFTKKTLKLYLKLGFWMLVGNQCVHMYYKPLKNFDEEVQRQLRMLEERAAKEDEEKEKLGKA